MVNRTLAHAVPRYTPSTLVNPDELRRELANIKRDGYAISDRQVETVSVSIAAPIYRGSRANVVAALSIIVPSVPGAAQRYLPAVLTSARGMSRALTDRGSGVGYEQL